MRLATRPLALVAVCGLAMLCTACSSNAKKIVGKWKLESMTSKDGKEKKVDLMGMTPILEFTADGIVKAGMDTSNVSAEFKKMIEKSEGPDAQLTEMKQTGKYKVSGESIVFTEMDNSEDGPLGKDNKGKLTFDGENLTITGENGSMKFTRMK